MVLACQEVPVPTGLLLALLAKMAQAEDDMRKLYRRNLQIEEKAVKLAQSTALQRSNSWSVKEMVMPRDDLGGASYLSCIVDILSELNGGRVERVADGRGVSAADGHNKIGFPSSFLACSGPIAAQKGWYKCPTAILFSDAKPEGGQRFQSAPIDFHAGYIIETYQLTTDMYTNSTGKLLVAAQNVRLCIYPWFKNVSWSTFKEACKIEFFLVTQKHRFYSIRRGLDPKEDNYIFKDVSSALSTVLKRYIPVWERSIGKLCKLPAMTSIPKDWPSKWWEHDLYETLLQR